MNESNINKLISKCGDRHLYQYLSLLIIFLLYGTTEFFVISLPLLETKPKVTYTNDKGETIKHQTIDYTICQKYPDYIIDSTSKVSSIVVDFKLWCDSTQTYLIGLFLFLGILIGTLTSNLFIDRFGRKKTALGFSLLYLFALISFFFINNIILIYAAMLFGGFFQSVVLISSIILLNEVINKKLIAIFTTIIYLAYRSFGLLYTFLFIHISDWRLVCLITGCIHIVVILLLAFLLVESPRYYIAVKDKTGLIKSLNYIAKVNKQKIIYEDCRQDEQKLTDLNTIDNNLITALTNADGCMIHSDFTFINVEEKNKALHSYNVFDLIKYKSQRFNFLIMNYLWFITGLMITAYNINIKNFKGSIYKNILILYGLNIVFTLVSGLLTNTQTFGRKNMSVLLILMSFVSMEMTLFGDEDASSNIYQLGLVITQVCLTCLYNIELLISNEVYPTVVRAVGLGYNSGFGRIGCMIAPILLEEIHIDTIIICFSALSVFGIMFSFFLSETYNKDIEDEIPEIVKRNKDLKHIKP
jgi:MFS family permease